MSRVNGVMRGELIAAIRSDKRKDNVEWILKQGLVDVNESNEKGWTPLIIACQCGDKDIVKLLLAHGADVRLKDSRGLDALLYASDPGIRGDILKYLNAEVAVKQGIVAQPIKQPAFEYDDSDLATDKTCEEFDDFDEMATAGYLIRAIHDKDNKFTAGHMFLLLQRTENINATDDSFCTFLMHATYKGRNDIVELLLDKGADPDLQDQEGCSALFHSACNGHKNITKLLLKKGADPDLRDSDGRDILCYCYNYPEIAEIIINHIARTVLAKEPVSPLGESVALRQIDQEAPVHQDDVDPELSGRDSIMSVMSEISNSIGDQV